MSDFSISESFVEKINNTTLYELENSNISSVGESKIYSPKSSKENLKVFKNITYENTIDPENESEDLLNTFNKLKSGDILLLSLSSLNNNAIENASITTDTITNHRSYYNEKIKKIESATEDNNYLLISENAKNVYLPYKKNDLLNYIKNDPTSYNSLQDVVKKEFILPFKAFKNQSSKTRFSETFKLLKNRNDHNFIKSVSYAFKVANKKNLNPVIISACKDKNELDSYISCLDTNNLKDFKSFDIIYEINPL